MNRVDNINRGMEEVRALSEVDIPSMKDKVGDEEWAIRVDLAAAYRLVAHYGWDDLIFTHLSARIPGPEHHFLLNPYQLMFEEVTASSLIKVDVNGNVFATGPGGVLVYSPDDKLLGRILTGVPTANVAFGEDGSTLFITANHRVLRMRTQTRGVPLPLAR